MAPELSALEGRNTSLEADLMEATGGPVEVCPSLLMSLYLTFLILKVSPFLEPGWGGRGEDPINREGEEIPFW